MAGARSGAGSAGGAGGAGRAVPPVPGPAGGGLDPGLDALFGSALDRCRLAVREFRRAPTPARVKTNVYGSPEPVCDLDLRLQAILEDAARRARPARRVVAEENRMRLGAVPDRCFLIDPLDGTVPFLYGSATYSIAICQIDAGRPAQSLVDLPGYGLRLAAAPGVLRVSGSPQALPWYGPRAVLTGPGRSGPLQALLERTAPGRYTVREVPTTSVKLVLVALGRAAAAVRLPAPGSPAVAPWDHAAAAMVLRAAGGRFAGAAGRRPAPARPTTLTGWLATAPGCAPPLGIGALLVPRTGRRTPR
ncbi:inositol monophosphatase family protein [Actinacidiphila sp. bgisy145]|uniref:inositol monophosphatase family protein n=1 Tax=Actinacidiphila sp. bgisy145 TaxID=3413792 RepID=UPI003EBAE4DC